MRPATILADVAVAVHPDDERYRDPSARRSIVPFVERRVPIVADEQVDPEFGTGALKVTPGHDPMDFEIGRDHGLPELAVIGLDGRMSEDAGELAGLTQDEAGERVLAWAAGARARSSAEPYRHAVPTCERCHTRIEPLIMLQWWCAMDELAAPAIAALRGRPRPLRPERTPLRVYLAGWRRPAWCISRQIWWGHRSRLVLPGRAHRPSTRTRRALRRVRLDRARRARDVLDTWFSSAL